MAQKQHTGYSAVRNNTCVNHRRQSTVDFVIDIPWDRARKGDPIHVSQYIDDDGDERERISSAPHENSVPRTIAYERNGRCFVKHMSQFDNVPPRSRRLGPAKVYWHGNKDFSIRVRDEGGHVSNPTHQRSPERRDPHRNLMR